MELFLGLAIGFLIIFFIVLIVVGRDVAFTSKPQEETCPKMHLSKEELDGIVLKKREQFLRDNKDYLRPLSEPYYITMDEDGKIQALKNVVMLECKYLGINLPEIIFCRADLDALGITDEDGTRIVIKAELIEDEWCVMKTIFHELYHVYQSQCVKEMNCDSNLLISREIAQWKRDAENLYDDEELKEHYVEYYTSASEISARDYAEERMKLYWEWVGTKIHFKQKC